ncbi:hypothetical protein OEZ85_014242 [Tetradesmus obliquus]|uniref:PPM-type phosphatase domain-containing protein n=1 Tax=Tetradesmus obliquus TaxID=3088 RepID=A0ABY8U7L7_TETOB|nr:hypothetical protein OEZ85_014242 [Tetradesmus obliquus]
MLMELVCIRPGYIWPAQVLQSEHQLPLCSDEGIAFCAGTAGRQLAGLFSGCGPAGADVAVVSSQILAGALAPQLLHDEQQTLAPAAALEAAFLQCHQQLLQLQPQQNPQANAGPGSTLDTATSGTAALLLSLDQSRSQLLVASAGLCTAVLARSSPAGGLTVLELTPRLALGHDPTETARLDAAGSSISYTQQAPPATAAAAATAATEEELQQASSSSSSVLQQQQAAVLTAPDGSVLHHVGASRLLGYSAATAAGVLPNPIVTAWRLTGSESFVVLGSPGLWQAMNPAEVVDYVAAALASGISSSSSSSSGPAAAAAAGKAAAAAAVSVGDLLTLEAQERLKLRLMDQLFGLVPGPAAPGAAGCVPDVSAVVLLLDGSSSLHRAAAAEQQQKMQQELAGISRACRSNAEAQALQALWSASCFCCDRDRAGPPAPALSSLLPALSITGHCWPSSVWPAASSITVPQTLLLQQQHGKAIAATAELPADASSGTSAAAAAAAAAGDGEACHSAALSTSAVSDDSSGRLSLVDAAVAAGILKVEDAPAAAAAAAAAAGGSSSSNAQPATASHIVSCGRGSSTRAAAFALSSRLSCELDLSHDHGGSCGSCGCLAGECSNSSMTSPSMQQQQQGEQQTMILHKAQQQPEPHWQHAATEPVLYFLWWR